MLLVAAEEWLPNPAHTYRYQTCHTACSAHVSGTWETLRNQLEF